MSNIYKASLCAYSVVILEFVEMVKVVLVLHVRSWLWVMLSSGHRFSICPHESFHVLA